MDREVSSPKLCFDSLIIEITRRCNLHCSHCLRGDAQDVDIEFKTIDNTLDQTEKIYRLFFTGGEPTLNLPAMQHTLDGLKARSIPLHTVEVITNGVLHSPEFVDIIREYSTYIDHWTTSDQCDNNAIKLAISVDKYHRGLGYDPLAAALYYSNELGDVATVKADRRGGKPINIGRAKKLQEAEPPSVLYSIPHKVHTLELGKPCDCRYAGEWKDLCEGQKIVCCQLHLSALGDIALFNAYNGAYQEEDARRDLIICNVSSSTPQEARNIEHGIEQYNLAFPTCNEAERQGAQKQQEYYDKDPKMLVHDLVWGYKALKENPKAMKEFQETLRQNTGAEEIFKSFMESLMILDDFAGITK